MTARAELGTLEATGLVQIAALQPELEYLFRHALVQEAAYATLLKQDRRTLHRAAADTILALHPGREREFAGIVAMHFEQAGEPARAAEHLVTAGEHALERFANREASAFFSRAFELATPDDVNLRLRAAIGAANATWTIVATGDEIDRLEAALDAGEGADPRVLTDGYFWVAFLRRQRGEVPETSPRLRRALERGAELGTTIQDPSAAAMPRALMGVYMAFTGQLRDGARQMREALEVIEQKGDRVSVAIVSDFLAMTYARLGEFDLAEATIANSQRVAAGSDAIARVDLEIASASLALERGLPSEACERAHECGERAEKLGAYACVVAANMVYGAASLAREDATSARPPLERGSEICRVTSMAPLRTLTHALLGSARARLGDVPGGVASWDDALEGARAMGDRFGEAQTLWGRGRTYASQKEWTTALPDIDRAVELFEEMEARPALARALRDRAGVLRGLGHDEEAARDEKRSGELATQLGLRDRI